MIPLLCAVLVVTVMAHSANGGSVFEFADEGKVVTFGETARYPKQNSRRLPSTWFTVPPQTTEHPLTRGAGLPVIIINTM